jgi:energy-converting hydrogenase Eha subunit C
MNELSKLVSQHKYDEAFAAALRISDVSIVYSLCTQVCNLIIMLSYLLKYACCNHFLLIFFF